MGSMHPDRIPFAVHATGANTVADMARLGWRVKQVCSCGLKTNPSYKLLCRLLGPDAELWDRHPICPRDGCGQRMTYVGRPPRTTIFRPLTSAERRRADGQ